MDRREEGFEFLELLELVLPGLFMMSVSALTILGVYHLLGSRALALSTGVVTVGLISARTTFQRMKNLILAYRLDQIEGEIQTFPNNYLRENAEILDLSFVSGLAGLVSVLIFTFWFWQISFFLTFVLSSFSFLTIIFFNFSAIDLAEELYIVKNSFCQMVFFNQKIK